MKLVNYYSRFSTMTALLVQLSIYLVQSGIIVTSTEKQRHPSGILYAMGVVGKKPSSSSSIAWSSRPTSFWLITKLWSWKQSPINRTIHQGISRRHLASKTLNHWTTDSDHIPSCKSSIYNQIRTQQGVLHRMVFWASHSMHSIRRISVNLKCLNSDYPPFALKLSQVQ